MHDLSNTEFPGWNNDVCEPQGVESGVNGSDSTAFSRVVKELRTHEAVVVFGYEVDECSYGWAQSATRREYQIGRNILRTPLGENAAKAPIPNCWADHLPRQERDSAS